MCTANLLLYRNRLSCFVASVKSPMISSSSAFSNVSPSFCGKPTDTQLRCGVETISERPNLYYGLLHPPATSSFCFITLSFGWEWMNFYSPSLPVRTCVECQFLFHRTIAPCPSFPQLAINPLLCFGMTFQNSKQSFRNSAYKTNSTPRFIILPQYLFTITLENCTVPIALMVTNRSSFRRFTNIT